MTVVIKKILQKQKFYGCYSTKQKLDWGNNAQWKRNCQGSEIQLSFGQLYSQLSPFPTFLASSGVHSIFKICWHVFRSIGGLAIKINSKIHFSLLYQWNVTGRRVWPTNLNFSVSQTLALLDQSNWTCLRKKSLICYKKELNVYKQQLDFGRLSSFLIPHYFPNYYTAQSFYISCFY